MYRCRALALGRPLKRLRPTLLGSAAGYYALLEAASPEVMTTVPPVGAQVSSVASPVEAVSPEGAMVLSSAAHVVAEVPAIGA